jgi:OmpA-OmpF porin, OOP family
MKRFFVIMIIAAMFMATSAQAADGKMYFALGAGASLPTDVDDDTGTNISFDPGWNVTGALGYDLGMVRVEGEIGYRMFDIDTVTGVGVPPGVTGDVSALTFMANAYYDFDMSSPLTPYLGFGLGVSDADVEVTAPGLGTLKSGDTEFSYQFMAGAAYDISSTMALTAGYRFFGIADSESPDIHEFNVGARFWF